MKITVITVVFNGARTITDCLASVARQTHPDIEHIVIDGASTDGTADLVRSSSARVARFISEPDRGMYDAMNKALALATGEVVAILNADDVYADDSVLSEVEDVFSKTGCDSCYGDLVYVRKDDVARVVRHWDAGEYRRDRFERAWMPPHPACFIRRSVYAQCGDFNVSYKIAADYDLLLRFMYKNNISSIHVPRIWVKMRIGGASAGSLRAIITANLECYRAWKNNGLGINPIWFILKPFSKLLQLRLP
jgi:glycosyltransferase